MILLDEIDRRAWAGAIVDDCPQDVDEPIRAMETPAVAQNWPQRSRDVLARLLDGALR